MYVALRNIMPTDKMLVPFTAAQPHRLCLTLLLHHPGCLVVVKFPKDHPRVTDTSNGAWGVSSIFLGCHATSPLVKVWIPSTGEIAYHKEVEIFVDKLPFVDPSCMPDRQGFSDKDIETTHKPNNRQAIPELAHACQHRQPLQRWCTQPMILHSMATFRSKRKLLLDLGSWARMHFTSTHGK